LSRPARPRRERVDLAALLADLAQLLRPELESKRARLDLEGPPLEVSADREQVRRLFLNLLVNALEFIGREGTITVRVEEGERARVVVSDDGAGVEESIRETLFEPYVSGRPGGTGLGLAIARRIALEHGWRIRYEPEPGGGTRMIVEVGSR
jgi:signal transduction histidine kinase